MPVAPSFQNFTRLSEPFFKNGKTYIKVKNPSTGTEREVRWYSDSEYAKAYGKKMSDHKDGWDGLKHARGFDNGPILVIRGNKAADEDWLRGSVARYAVGIGWYIASTDVFPDDAPEHLKYLLLGWDEFRDGDDRHMKKPSELSTILDRKARAKEWVKMK